MLCQWTGSDLDWGTAIALVTLSLHIGQEIECERTNCLRMRAMKTKTWLPLVVVVLLGSSWRVGLAEDSKQVAAVVTADHIDFLVGKDLVGRYHIDKDNAKPYFWPLLDAAGTPLTRDWPMTKAQPLGSSDHPHQKSAWFTHGDVIAEGIEPMPKIKGIAGVDFWAEARGHGQTVCTRVETPRLADNRAEVTTHNEWRAADGRKLMDETRVLHLYNFGDTRLFVVDIDLLASAAAITFGDTKEGSFGVRINDLLREQGGKGSLENADGKVGEKNCWGRTSAWCDYSGPLGGKTVGLTIFDDPHNPYPACWHSRGYGLMAANPFGRSHSGFPAMQGRTDLVRIPKGEELKLRYGLLLHPGNARDGRVAEYYDKFKKLRD